MEVFGHCLEIKKRYLTLLLLGFTSISSIVIAYEHKDGLAEFLNRLAQYVRDSGLWGVVATMSCIFLTAFPPMVGYSPLLVLCGFVYGYPGFVIAYSGALAGGLVSFLLARWVFRYAESLASMDACREKVVAQMHQHDLFAAVNQAITKKGLYVLLLIRVAPYPYNVFNVLLAVTSVAFPTYALATALSLAKVMVHISVGRSLKDMSDLFDDSRDRLEHVLVVAVGVMVTAVLFVLLYRAAQAELREAALEGLGEAIDVEASDVPRGDDVRLLTP